MTSDQHTRATPRQATSYMTAPGEPPAPDDPLLQFAPVPHVAPRRNSITAERQRAFIAHLAATGIVKQAARHIGASLEAIYALRHKPGGEAFSAAWDAALERGVGRLEDCALGRAIEGEERLVVSSGKVLGTERRHNEALVTFFLRHRRADRYGAQIGPGHPLYEGIREEVVAEVEQCTAQRVEREMRAEESAEIKKMRDHLQWVYDREDELLRLLGEIGYTLVEDRAGRRLEEAEEEPEDDEELALPPASEPGAQAQQHSGG